MRRLFELLLEQHEQDRHRAILRDAPGRRREPVGDAKGVDGFLPPADAAEEMSIGVEQLRELVLTGRLEWREVGGQVWVRPAIVSSRGFR